jgi:hypothetical protein
MMAAPAQKSESVASGSNELGRRQRTRSIAIALALVGLVLMFYIATVVRLGGNVWNRAL